MSLRLFSRFHAVVLCSTLTLSGLGLYAILKDNPRDVAAALKQELSAVARPSTIVDRHGRKIGAFVEELRIETPLSKIPKQVQKAFLAAEDAEFYRHSGVSPKGILRSLWVNIRRERVAQGGSTVTQQLVRQFLLSRERTIFRKIREVDLALRLERQLSKDEILELWLNNVYLGNNAWGVAAAARNYFHKDISALNTGEAAILAGLPQAPSRYAPHVHPENSKKRKHYVLGRMVAAGWLSASEAQRWRREPSAVWRDRRSSETSAPWITEHVRLELWQQLEQRNLPRTGLVIKTHIERDWQWQAQKLFKQHLTAFRGSGLEAAFVAVDLTTGAIRTEIGGIDFERNQYNRAARISRPLGDTINPMIFAWAADAGVISVSGQQTLGAAAITSSFRDVDPVASMLGLGILRERLKAFNLSMRETAALDEVLGSPTSLAQLWRTMSGRPIIQNRLITQELKTADDRRQAIRGHSTVVGGIDENAAYSLKSWLSAAGFQGRVGEQTRISSDKSWNHWDVAVSQDTIAVLWMGADKRPPSDPESFVRMKQQTTKLVDQWLIATGNTSSRPKTAPPPGLSWHLVTGPNGKVVRVPFPVIAH